MVYREYKVVHIVEGVLGTLFLGSSGLPLDKMERELNYLAKDGWQVVFQIIEKKKTVAFLGKRSHYYYLRSINQFLGKVFFKDSRNMSEVESNSVNLIITSPPYFNAKKYSDDRTGEDLGNIDNYKEWKQEISKVWKECFRVLQPGRKTFINIMNLPISNQRNHGNGFKTLNLVGHTIDICEDIGFLFKREIIWHKTNGVKAHFGTYPYPGNILLNNMHEQILEFEKPAPKHYRKYEHITAENKEKSKLDKEFWLSLKNTDVWFMKPYKSGSREHIAPFPMELPKRLIKAYSFIGEVVLDPFGGMGTTAKACLELDRDYILYEINQGFQEIIEKNITNLFNKKDDR